MLCIYYYLHICFGLSMNQNDCAEYIYLKQHRAVRFEPRSETLTSLRNALNGMLTMTVTDETEGGTSDVISVLDKCSYGALSKSSSKL